MAKDPTIDVNPGNETPVDSEEGVKTTTRRQVLRRAAAVGAGVAAAAYVKPSMQSLGISSAQAQAAPGIATLEEPPPPPGTNNCSISVSNFTAVPNFATNTISGGFTVTNTGGICVDCLISFWQITVQTGNPPGGCGQDLTTNKVAQKNNSNAANSGGALPIALNVSSCGPRNFTYEISYPDPDGPFTVTLNLDIEPSPQHPGSGANAPFKACASIAGPQV